MASFLSKLNFGFLGGFGAKDGFVAFDIGSSSVKMIEAVPEKSGWRLLNAGTRNLPAGAVQNNMIVDSGAVVAALRGLIQENGVTATKVIAAVPGRSVIMKKLELPAQKEEELDANVEFEANKIIPENLENVNLDYQVVNYLEGGGKIEVLLVAVRKEIVESYTEVITQAGLEPAVMDVDYFAMESMYESNYEPQAPGEVIGLVHIGARYTSINVLSSGVSTFTGDLPVGGEEFTDSLRRSLQLSSEDAESLKITGKLNGQEYVELDEMLRPTSESLAEDIRRTLSLYGAIAAEDGIRTIYLSGGGARLRGLAGVLEEKLGVPVKLADPFRGFKLDRKINVEYLQESASQFGLGVGLAIRRPGDK
jgi:type IV pilus assembly protein PilM